MVVYFCWKNIFAATRFRNMFFASSSSSNGKRIVRERENWRVVPEVAYEVCVFVCECARELAPLLPRKKRPEAKHTLQSPLDSSGAFAGFCGAAATSASSTGERQLATCLRGRLTTNGNRKIDSRAAFPALCAHRQALFVD